MSYYLGIALREDWEYRKGRGGQLSSGYLGINASHVESMEELADDLCGGK